MRTEKRTRKVTRIVDDEYLLRSKNVLTRVFLLIAILSAAGLVATFFLYERKLGSVIIIAALSITIGTAMFLLWQGKIKSAGLCTVAGVWGVFACLVFMGGGLGNINALFFVSLTVVAGLLLGERVALLVAGAGVAMGFGLAMLEMFGRLPEAYFMGSPLSNWAQLVFALILTTSTLNLALRERSTALSAAQQQLADRIEADKALHASQEQYDKLLATIPDLVVRTDSQGAIQFFNEMVVKVSGYEHADLVGKNMISFIAPRDQEEAFHNTLLMIERPLGPKTYHLLMKSGEERVFEVNGDVLRSEAGEPYSFVYVLRDITERMQMENESKTLRERLYRAEKMEALGTLAGGVAHDLNNILGVMVGYSELLAQKLPTDSNERRHAENILSASLRGAAIIQDLLTLARRGVSVAQVVCLNKVIGDYLQTPEFEALKARFPEVRIAAELDDELLPIKGSPVHLAKAIMNLVTNAAESIGRQGTVTVRTQSRYLDEPVRGYDQIESGDYAVVTVSDTGCGISPADLGQIFEPFYTKKVMGRSGTGLGLAVVWGTVKDHRGYIDARSKEGEGSTITLYFPVTRDAPAQTVTAASPASYKGRGESILVVDDVKEQREVAAGLLTSIGYTVSTVPGGEDAVAHLQKNKADLVLLDMIMAPGIDGMETYRRILEINPVQKAIIVSGFSETEDVRKTLQMGAGVFVRKPYTLEKIGLAVRAELDRTSR
ncbi:ATP-binding protein [Desulfatitalea alkaliphila]|uniref:histidine kinase n=1 Tax=Desulfatitalea alkaliphila TaxID=2929485 RepID=A0AA41R0L7_9BACT|nr:ATP-binding protein [Desulfatitalea alkaliphila]MCJ8499764.1 ATP-binding protein [Desulfatitalea alkaliphila]